MHVSDLIPLTAQPWNRNPDGYVRHQSYLYELVQWLETQGVPVSLPEDTGTWDKGVDLYVGDLRIDLKGFGLDVYSKSLVWSSTYYQGRSAPIYKGTETDYFIHSIDGPPSEWIVAHVSDLRTSMFGHAPFYYKDRCMTVADLVQGLFTSHPF